MYKKAVVMVVHVRCHGEPAELPQNAHVTGTARLSRWPGWAQAFTRKLGGALVSDAKAKLEAPSSAISCIGNCLPGGRPKACPVCSVSAWTLN
jgi:hypothetical protein